MLFLRSMQGMALRRVRMLYRLEDEIYRFSG